MNIRDYDPVLGQAFQGDVSITPVPADIPLATDDEIKPIDGRLIIQEGEVTHHHHAIRLERHFRDDTRVLGDPTVMPRSAKLRKALGGKVKGEVRVAHARMFRDAGVANEMVRRGILTRADLAIATLVVEHGPVTVTHEEHDGIRVPPGRYLIGRQIESAGAEERVVQD
jgi:hypothetical protein